MEGFFQIEGTTLASDSQFVKAYLHQCVGCVQIKGPMPSMKTIKWASIDSKSMIG